MNPSKSHYDVTAAEKKSIGFDYQYYYFLLQLLQLKDGQQIGLEVKDDIHIEQPGKKLQLLQLKHTLQTVVSGDAASLTERDLDLWKTIHNWIDIIEDGSEGRIDISTKLQFIRNTEFVLVTNKSFSTSNKFLANLAALQEQRLSVEDFEEYLTDLISNTTDSLTNHDLISYMKKFLKLDKDLLLSFANKIQFQLQEDDLIARIKNEIRNYMVAPEKIEDVYECLNSNLRDNNYFSVKTNSKIIITFDDFYNKYRNCFANPCNLPIRRLNFDIPDDYLDQVFVRQLIDIGEINAIDKQEIIEFTRLKLLMYNNLEAWIQKGELSETQKKVFFDNCITIWQNHFRAAHRDNNRKIREGMLMSEIEQEICESGINCLDRIRAIILQIENQQLDVQISNGQFYLLSDKLLIGWHLDFQNKYKTI